MFFLGLTMAQEETRRPKRGKGIVSYDKLDNEELLNLVIKGDQEAFRRFYQNTDRSVYGYILSIMKNPQDAEELMQETYLKIWTSSHLYKDHGKALAWVFTIAKNLCYMRLRSRKRESDISLEDVEQGELCPQIENIADKMVLESALEFLTEEERQIVLLHAGSGMKHREIAGNLSMPLSTVLSKYSRAIKKLEKKLTERGESDG